MAPAVLSLITKASMCQIAVPCTIMEDRGNPGSQQAHKNVACSNVTVTIAERLRS